jgi:TonB-dependent SusC/RagA subfamily outer membrane receptor
MPVPGVSVRRTLRRAFALVAMAGCGGVTPAPEGPTPEAAPATGSTPAADDRSSLDRDPVRDPSYSRIEDLIEGRASGVQVIRRPDGTISLRIRGLGSPSGSNDPLLIVDGMTIQPVQLSQTLLALHPQDIVRIDVLKDAASTAFYGMRGANGVIVVTTRRQ